MKGGGKKPAMVKENPGKEASWNQLLRTNGVERLRHVRKVTKTSKGRA